MKQVTRNNLLRRVKRWFDNDEEVLRKTRRTASNRELGDYHIADRKTGKVIVHDVFLEKLGRSIGALKDDEQIV